MTGYPCRAIFLFFIATRVANGFPAVDTPVSAEAPGIFRVHRQGPAVLQGIPLYFHTRARAVRTRLHLENAPSTLEGFDVYLNGERETALRLTEEGRGQGGLWKPGVTEWVRLGEHVRPGFNQLILVPQYAARSAREVAASGRPLVLSAEITSARRMDPEPYLQGWARINDFQARCFRVLSDFDRMLRSSERGAGGNPIRPRREELERELTRLLEDPIVDSALAEMERIYFFTWREPLHLERYLAHHVEMLRRVEAYCDTNWPLLAVGTLYRENPAKTYLAETLHDIALSQENLRNAHAVLAADVDETVLDRLKSIDLLLRQDTVLTDKLVRGTERVGEVVGTRLEQVQKNSASWRRDFERANRAILASLKTVPMNYPSDGALVEERRAFQVYLDQVREIAQMHIGFVRIQQERTRSFLPPEPGADPPLPPRKEW
jgi:hypothetical protein